MKLIVHFLKLSSIKEIPLIYFQILFHTCIKINNSKIEFIQAHLIPRVYYILIWITII